LRTVRRVVFRAFRRSSSTWALSRVGDRPIRLGGRVLVDQCRLRAVVAHPCHQVAQARPSPGRERVAGVPQVVEVQAPGGPVNT